MEIEWEAPPRTAKINGKALGKYAEFAILLEGRPEEWAKVPLLHGNRTESSAAALAQNIRRGVTKGFTKGLFESAFEGTEVWARYVPPTEATTEPDPYDEAGKEGPSDYEEEELVDPKAVRAWARDNGITMPERGRIGGEIVEKYLDARRRDQIKVASSGE